MLANLAMHGAVHARRGEIGHALGRKTTEISSGTLEDFDWSLRLCMGSDQLATLRRPLLLLSLTVARIRCCRSASLLPLQPKLAKKCSKAGLNGRLLSRI